MFEHTKLFQNGFENYVHSLGVQTFRYGNATHAFADILSHLKNGNGTVAANILIPSFLPAKLFKTVLAYGYTPKFYQIDQNCQFDVNEILSLIDKGTKAILVIHYFGHPAKIRILREIADAKNLFLIEDCAHVIYARDIGGILGTWGDFSIFSPRKMLNLPEGGYLVLNKRFTDFIPSYKKRVNSLYTLLKLLQTRGKHFYFTLTKGKDFLHVSKIPVRGYIDYDRVQKSPLKNISALTSIYSKMTDIRVHIEKRMQNYNYLYEGIKEFQFLKPLFNEHPDSWTPYSFPVIVEKGYRDLLQQEMFNAGISCGAGWPESPFEKRFNKTLELSQNLIEFPVHPFITPAQLNKILEVCNNFGESVVAKQKRDLNRMFASKDILIPAISEPGSGSGKKWIDKYLEHFFDDKVSENNGVSSSDEHIRTEIIKSEDGFDSIKNDWESLCEESDVHIFQTFDWQRLWWKYFGNEKQLYLILFYSENNFRVNKLVGIAPFFIDTKYFGKFRILNRLRFIGSGIERNKSKHSEAEYGVSDYLDLIIEHGYEKKVAKVLADYLKKQASDYDVVQLDELNSSSITVKHLLPLLKGLKWTHKVQRREICPRINLTGTLNGFLNQLNPKVRYQLKKIHRDLSENKQFDIKEIKSQYDLHKSYFDFVDLHQKRWNRIGLPGLFSDARYEHFLEEIVHTFLKSGHLNFTTVYFNNECLAAECAFEYKNHYYDYLKAFDDQSPLAKYRPGKALLFLLVEKAVQNNAEVVDLLRGAEDYKFEFTSFWHWTYKLTISNPKKNHFIRYACFLTILFFINAKRHFSNEINVIATLIKNFGFFGFSLRYLPSTAKKIKHKFNSILGINNLPAIKHNEITADRNKTTKKKNISTLKEFADNLSNIHRERLL